MKSSVYNSKDEETENITINSHDSENFRTVASYNRCSYFDTINTSRLLRYGNVFNCFL